MNSRNFSEMLILGSLNRLKHRLFLWIKNIVGFLDRNLWKVVLGIVYEVEASWSLLTLGTKSSI